MNIETAEILESKNIKINVMDDISYKCGERIPGYMLEFDNGYCVRITSATRSNYSIMLWRDGTFIGHMPE